MPLLSFGAARSPKVAFLFEVGSDNASFAALACADSAVSFTVDTAQRTITVEQQPRATQLRRDNKHTHAVPC